MSFIPKGKHDNSIQVKVGLTNLDSRDDVNAEHSVSLNSRRAFTIGFERTQDEIDRLWEYRRMMGK